MALHLYNNDRSVEYTTDIDLGQWGLDESEWKRFLLVNDGGETYVDFTMSIEQGSGTTNAYHLYEIAPEFLGDPAAPYDYLAPWKLKNLFGYQIIPFYMKFSTLNADPNNNPQLASLHITTTEVIPA